MPVGSPAEPLANIVVAFRQGLNETGFVVANLEARASALGRDAEEPYSPPSAEFNDIRHNICRTVDRCGSILFLRFELFDECSEMRGGRSCEGVVLVLEALPNC